MMIKRRMFKKFILVVLSVVSVFTLIACNGGGQQQEQQKDGATTITFWGYGEATEIQIFRELVNQFNEDHKGEIYVDYVTKPGNNYYEAVEQIIAGNRCPDVVYVGDDVCKSWATNGYIVALDDYVSNSEIIDLDNMWESGIQRYRYDVDKGLSTPDAPLWALPKDIGPTVLYYNIDYFQNAGIHIISKDKEEVTQEFVDSFNATNGTHFTVENMQRGFYRDGIDDLTKWSVPKAGEEMVFNNRIAMTWEESENLFKIFTQSYNSASPSKYGYFTEWWFSYGWSVGGDCIKYDETAGHWRFSLGDTTQYYNNNGVLTTDASSGGVAVPTMLEAFTKFVQLSQPKTNDIDGKGTMGLAITPSPNTLNTVGKEQYFTSGQVATMVDGRWAVPVYRQASSLKFDCAPLPKAENGIEAGHCGSVGFVIPTNSKHHDEAFTFIEFMSGPEGQAKQAESGFNIPNQKDIAMTDVFLQPGQMPANSIIFVRAAEYQRAGDWNYLVDRLWIDEWADYLNDEVRNGKNNLTDFFNVVTDRTNKTLKEKY